uniref:LLM class flavin-dependent oxidoreductase n=1 Tax=Macrostomum lignano TaxID=282301 RepID=A0A1I8H7R9_9PLAT
LDPAKAQRPLSAGQLHRTPATPLLWVAVEAPDAATAAVDRVLLDAGTTGINFFDEHLEQERVDSQF